MSFRFSCIELVALGEPGRPVKSEILHFVQDDSGLFRMTAGEEFRERAPAYKRMGMTMLR